jgi:DHA2 family methylenomycin A resistance protein-like MFS transporter
VPSRLNPTRAERRARTAALAALTLGASAIVLADASVATLAPQLRVPWQLDLADLGWIGSAYSLATALLVLPTIVLVRRLGQRLALTLGLALFALATAGLALAPGFATVVAARAVQGAATALVAPTMLACLRTLFPPLERSRAIAVWSGVSTAMLGVGPIVGATLSAVGGWRIVFLLEAVPAVVGAVAAWVALPPIDRDARAPRGLAVLTLAFALLEFALVTGNASVVSAVIVSALLLVATLRRRNLSRMLISARFSVGAAASLVTSGLLNSLFFLVPLYDQIVLRLKAFDAGVSLAILVLPVLVVGPLTARWTAQRGNRLPITAGALALVAAFVGATQWSPHLRLHDTAPVLLLAGAGLGALLAPTTAIALSGVPRDRVGEGAAKLACARTLGVGLGIWSAALLTTRQPPCDPLLHLCLDAISNTMLRPFGLGALIAAVLAIAGLTLFRGGGPSGAAATMAASAP